MTFYEEHPNLHSRNSNLKTSSLQLTAIKLRKIISHQGIMVYKDVKGLNPLSYPPSPFAASGQVKI